MIMQTLFAKTLWRYSMKKSIGGILVALLAITMITTGCTPAAPKADGKIKVGLSLPTQQEYRWVSDKETMEAVAAELGIELVVTVASNDAAQQATQVEQLLAQDIKVLILAPVDGAAAATLADQAAAKGIKVIAYDRMIMNTSIDVYMSFDNEIVGEMQGKFITETVPAGKYIIMAGDPADNNATLFKKGAMKYIQPLIDNGSITVIADQAVDKWDPSNAMKIVEQALVASKNDVQAILAPNDGTAGGSIQALAAQKLDGKVPITGQDAEAAAAKRILEGTQSMTIYKDTRALGRKAIEVAIQFAKGETVDTAGKVVANGKMDIPSVLLPPEVVTKDNVKTMLVDSGYLKASDVGL